MAKPALGRGLGALLGGSPVVKTQAPATVSSEATPPRQPTEPGERVQTVPIDRIQRCPFQPRKDFSAETLQELADSISAQGIIQPLIVRERNDRLELIAGERRWRAAQMIGLPEVPVVVRQADDRTVLELALIENLQRDNLNPIEEAQGYSQLAQQFQLTQEEIAKKVGKSRTLVTNSLRLLKLPPPVQTHIREGRLSVGHAKVILGLDREEQQKLAADRILKEALNVRQAEVLVARLQAARAAATGAAPPRPSRDAHLSNLENKLRERLGTKVNLRYLNGRGALEISFFSDAELERILHLLGVSHD